MEFFYYASQLFVFLLSWPMLKIVFFIFLWPLNLVHQICLEVLSLDVETFLLVALLLGCLQADWSWFNLSFIFFYLFSDIMLSPRFLTKVGFFSFKFFDFNFYPLNLFGPFLLLVLANLDVFLNSLHGNFELSPHLCKLSLLGLILFIKHSLAMQESLIILNINLLLFGPFDLIVTRFQQFSPITLYFL